MFKVILISLGVYVVLCLLIFLFQGNFLFQGSKLPTDYEYQVDGPYEEVWFGEENQYHALHMSKPDAKGVIVYFHGNRGSLRRWIKLTSGLTRYPFDLLLVEYPEYGKSTAKLSQEAIEELALESYSYALTNSDEKDIVIYGRSIGSGIASWLASKTSPRMLILETPYYSLQELVSRYLFIFPTAQLLRYNFPSYRYLSEVEFPVLIFHGTKDNVVPFWMGEKLHRSLTNQSELVVVEGAEHDNISDYQEYWKTLDGVFLN